MVRRTTKNIDGQDLIITMLSKRDADEIEATHRVKYWLTKKMEMLDIISGPQCDEQADWAKKEYDKASMKFDEALSKSSFDTALKMLRENEFVTKEWLEDDAERYSMIEREISSFKSGSFPVMDRAIDIFINHYKSNATLMVSGQEVIDKLSSIIDYVIHGEDKKK